MDRMKRPLTALWIPADGAPRVHVAITAADESLARIHPYNAQTGQYDQHAIVVAWDELDGVA